MYPTAAITLIQGGDPCIPRLDDRNVEIQESEVEMETRVIPEKTKDTSQITLKRPQLGMTNGFSDLH